MTPAGELPVTADDVRRAAARLAGVAHRTPAMSSRSLDEMTGAEVVCKAEVFQRGGAFKFRGAYNAIASLTAEARRAGIVTYSSGNHAQAVALAARELGTDATILMPTDAPAPKLAATRAFGAEVVAYDRYAEDRDELGRRLVAERGGVLIPPFDHADVIAGQGTVAAELLADAPGLDLLVVPVGGGGLVAGCALVAAEHGVEVVGVEPAARTVARDAMEAGHPVVQPVPRTIADGQQTPAVGALPCRIMLRHVAGVVGVTDDAIRHAMRVCLERCKVVVEPSGASALAAVLAGEVAVAGRRVGIVLSGGNVAAADLGRLLDGSSS